MNNEERDGHFTRNLFSLQLQIQTLLEGAGGNNTAQLLDALSDLTASERKVTLRVFQRALDKVKAAGVRLETREDAQLAEFESTLYDELVDGMTAVQRTSSATESRKFSVVDGGKLPTRKKDLNKMVCLQEVRRQREENRTLN